MTEAMLQLVLQLFIIFNRADREPTTLQCLVLATSLISIVNSKVEALCSKNPQSTLGFKASLIPFALCQYVFICGSIGLIISTIHWNYVQIPLGPIILALSIMILIATCSCFYYCFCCFCLCFQRNHTDEEKTENADEFKQIQNGTEDRTTEQSNKNPTQPIEESLDATTEQTSIVINDSKDVENGNENDKVNEKLQKYKLFEALLSAYTNWDLKVVVSKYLIFYQFFANTITLSVIAFLVNQYPDTEIWNLWDDAYKLSDLAIVKRGYFNIVLGVCLSSGFLTMVLFFSQIRKMNA